MKTLKEVEEGIIKEKIEKAKAIAKNDYETLMDNLGVHNVNYKRFWRETIKENGDLMYALNGTPDKAYVFVYRQEGKIVAVRPSGTIIKIFDI